ncbi:SDR family NAD(P)-dependent oxidoreductase [Sinimarinibacterium sp. NLF-5-8]|uniref:SDR family NAD(P)-dependent oxidoreductase n=1 Tax=Sinimarinibacterium sp. NLF-5-8 TaxID=2698684 RepID=UPI00137BF514|nr:SDR family NAD(P)-dependent oxidoreductase [Sinimarinibacterium sp. NLF-5-8]QHS09881.1 SDR family NAD(P)-dependent oxidoreductase [Sinimarinibacterium sp. NLF-5-8]
MTKSITRAAQAVVTGAGSGIGRAFALELAARGGTVVCADIRLEAAQQTVALIEARGGTALAVTCDVGDLAAVERLAEQAEAFFGAAASVVINNAGIGIGGQNIGQVTIQDWRFTMNVNLWGVIHGCHVFAPRLRASGQRGGIINVGSTASFAVAPSIGPYNVTKAAVLALTETLSAELAGTGVAVTALCPTFVKTNIVKDGRIAGGGADFAAKLIAWTGVSPEGVARKTLDALDRNQLYVLPQIEARMIWRAKRLTPVLYARGAGLLNRFLLKKVVA